jgi:hypothetical protein
MKIRIDVKGSSTILLKKQEVPRRQADAPRSQYHSTGLLIMDLNLIIN